MTNKKALWGVEIGPGLLSATVVLLVVAVFLMANLPDLGVRIIIVVLAVAAIAVLWTAAYRNGREEREFRARLRAEHPGALVERVRLWSLPHGPVAKDTPTHFVIADASEISFQTVNQTVLLRIPVAELGFVDLVTAQHDRVKDKALTLIYGDEQNTVQLFTVSYDANERLGRRLRTAIGWPPRGTPSEPSSAHP